MPDLRITGSSSPYGMPKDPSQQKKPLLTPEEKKEQEQLKNGGQKDSAEVRRVVQELTAIEKKVIAHEQAHKSVGGEFTGPASYSYSVGPDGKRYVSGGEVSIKMPATDNKEQMLQILERVKQAALAPADPSGQDIRVASSAAAKQANLRSEILKEKAAKAYGNAGKATADPLSSKDGSRFDHKI